MENGIELEEKGFCKDCPVADLDTKWLYIGTRRTWQIVCNHSEACERILELIKKEEK